jgi:thymidylate synthase (FAD)
MKVTLTRVTENPIGAIEEAACNCYDSEPTGGKIMKSCYKSGHHSVLEFADFTFHISGVSRALTHQLVRHRLASYAQRSQRYCGENEFNYIVPLSICKNKEAYVHYNKFMRECNKLYEDLQKDGIPNEDARYILPNACETVIEVKMNFRTLIHFMNERLCSRAQWEIRQLALLMKKAIEEQYPELAKYLVPKCEIHEDMPFCTEHNTCGRHPLLKDIYSKFIEVEDLIYDLTSSTFTDEEFCDKFWEYFCHKTTPKEQ